MLTITPLYAACTGLLFLWLSLNVIRVRFRLGASVGDMGEKTLIKAMRLQANCAEYAPITLLLIAMAELQGAAPWLIHFLGALIFFGRLAHAIGFGRKPQIIPLRQAGMILTFASLALAALTCLAMLF